MPSTTASGQLGQDAPVASTSTAGGAAAAAAATSNHARPRASSSVCVRPQLLNSRLRSRSLLKAAASDTAGGTGMTATAASALSEEGPSSHEAMSSESAPSSPRFGATLLPRLAAVFSNTGSGAGHSSNSSSNSSSNNYSSYSTTPYSFSSSSATSFSPDRTSLSDSGSSMLTYGGEDGGASSSTMPSTPSSSIEDSNPFSKSIHNSSNISGKKTKTAGSPIANLPFLPRRRTLSNLLNQITSSTGSGKEKGKEASQSTGTSIRDATSASPTYNSLQLLKKESTLSTPSNKARHTSETHMHVPPHGWSTSTSAVPPSPASTSSYSNPFASAFSYAGDPSSSTSVIGPRPSSPRLKKKDSYLALNIPPTPGGAPTPSLAYTENGNRPLRGEDENLILPSPITEADEQEHPTHPHHRHHYHSTVEDISSAPIASVSSPSYSSIAAQPISSSTSFLASLTSNAPTLSTQRASHQTLSKLLPPILFLCISFVVSLTIMFYMVSTIPLTIPHNISEIKVQTVALRDYSRKGISEGLHVSAVLSALFVFKQAFSVPGSILVNILFGSLYGTYAATVCACIFTGVGSVLAYYMARLCAPLVERFFPRALATTKSALLSGSPSDLFSYLLLARLFPLLPYSALNIACGVLKVPVSPYFITLVLGSFPYNFVTTQLGDLLGNLANSAEAGNINAIWTWDLIFKLAVASILSAAPIIFKEQLKGFIGGSNGDQAIKTDAHASNPARDTVEAEHIPLSPLANDTSNSEQPHSSTSYGRSEQESGAPAPLLRRDRTDSSASEVLFAPALELSSLMPSESKSISKHKSQWSFSWKSLRRSFNNESACSDYSAVSAGSSSFASHSTARTSLDEEIGDTDEENARDQINYYDLQRRSSGSSYHSFASRYSQNQPIKTNDHNGHSRPSSIDFSITKHGRRTASIESASSSPTVAQHHQFGFAPHVAHSAGRLSQDWDRF